MVSVALGLITAGSALAQVLPPQINPGANEIEQRRQLEQLERQQQRPQQQGPAVVGPARPQSDLLKPGGPKFPLKKLEFDDSKFLSKEELDKIAADYVGRKIDFSDLQKLLAAINELYTSKGIPTGIATLPPQQVKNGVVKIKLTEGRLDKLTVTGNVQTYPGYILKRVEQPSGEVLDVPKLSRDVTWFNRTNDAQVRALLQPGASFGLTDVQLAVTEVPVDTLQLFSDNQGVRSTGRYQGGVYYRRSGALGFDDRFTFYGTVAEGSLNGSVSYNLPINDWGGRLGASYTQGGIRIVQGPFADLGVKGQSALTSVNFAQPLVATDSWLLLANVAAAAGVTRSKLSDFTVTDDHSHKATAGFALTHSGTDYTITVAPAYNYLETQSVVNGTTRHFDVYSATFSALARLPANFSFSAFGSAQYTPDKHDIDTLETLQLPGDQLFQIGGPTTVRGYPTNSVAGNSGYYANFELHNNLSQYISGLDVFAFIDRGEVFSVFPTHTELTSAGAGLSWTPHVAFTLESSIGFPWNSVVPGQPMYQAYFRGIIRPLLLLPAAQTL